MIISDLLGWWYVHGWSWLLRQMFVVRVRRITEFFSMADMLKTLFAPFRQDSVDTKRASIGIKLQVLGGNLISRVFGFGIRTTLLVIGSVAVLMQWGLGLVAVLLWALAPLAPIVAVGLMVGGVGL